MFKMALLGWIKKKLNLNTNNSTKHIVTQNIDNDIERYFIQNKLDKAKIIQPDTGTFERSTITVFSNRVDTRGLLNSME